VIYGGILGTARKNVTGYKGGSESGPRTVSGSQGVIRSVPEL
jgi:hypothetical protein